jgi:hypothetical protein
MGEQRAKSNRKTIFLEYFDLSEQSTALSGQSGKNYARSC